MAKINLNQSPYFDDYNENKKFYRILFRPGRAVQARELTQLQTALQKQIERMGAHIFEQGAQVLPGSKEGVRYINNNGFIKLPRSNTYFTDTEEQLETYWMGKNIISIDAPVGTRATVIGYREADTLSEVRLYVSYTQASTNGVATSFVPGQTIQTDEIVPVSAPIVASSYGVGLISSVIVEEGVYFFDGNFILVDQQQVFIVPENTENQNAWNNNPTADVGLRITESIISSEEDESLLDNALGSPNYSAPGADRLHISADLIQTDLNNTDTDFIPLLRVRDGVVLARVIRTEYSVLEDTLARRTYDESGDYSVIPFQIQILDFLRDELNNGAHVESEFYFETEEEAEESSIVDFHLETPGAAVIHPIETDKWIPGTSYNTVGDPTSFLQLCNNHLTIKVDPGKAYVKGYEIEKLATTLVDVQKSRTLRFRDNKTLFTPLGEFVYITNVAGAPTFENYDEVELHSTFISTPLTSPGTKIGTARVLAVDHFQGVTGTTGIYRLFLFDIKADTDLDLRQLKSIYSDNPSFTADCVPEAFRLNGAVDSGSGPLSDYLIGTGTSWKNDESQRLQAGDVLRVGVGESSQVYTVLENPPNDNQIKVDPAPDTAQPGSIGLVVDYLWVAPQTNSNNSGLIYKLPDNFIATLRSGSQGTIDTNPVTGIDTVYTSRRIISDATSPFTPVANQLIFNVTGTEEFDDFSTNGYVVINLTNGTWMQILPYIAGSPGANAVEIAPLGTQLTIYFNAADGADQYYIVAPIIHSGGLNSQERGKTLVKGSFPGGIYSGPSVVSVGSDVSSISLEKADVLRITRIVESPDYNTAPSNLETLPSGHKNVTGLYLLDNGQKDYYYDIAKVTLRPGYTRPRGQIRIEFDYFTHQPTGNYFSVDSYSISGLGKQMDYEDIPEFVSSDGTIYDLASSVDFRPRVNEPAGTSGGFSTFLELPKDNFRCDYHFYEGRIDNLYLDKSGKFFTKKGNPDIIPEKPEDPETGMTIYELDFSPYTALPEDCQAKYIDNRRYTMRDIGKLEKRIKNLEFYTSLSLLETSTNELRITDALGNDKFKNGFLTDNFKAFNGDLTSSDYKAAIDTVEGIARPIIKQDNVALFEKVLLEPNNAQREFLRNLNNYQKTGDYLTLPYEPVALVEQTQASKVTNVNPYAVFTFVGSVKITPWSDEWREVENRQPLTVIDQGLYQATKSTFGPTGTTIDYQQTIQNWVSTTQSTPERTGRTILEVAGHAVLEQLTPQQRKKAKKNGFVVVPEGYANAGQVVPVGRSNMIADELKSTTTLHGQAISTALTSTFVDAGYSQPQSLGVRTIDTASIEYMRSRDITFEARGFMPGAKLYAFFDGVDVNVDCKPSTGNFGDTLICDSRGRLSGTFRIPNRQGKRFKTGDRTFRLTTSPTNVIVPPPASAGESPYTSRGWLDIKQETFTSTRLFTVERKTVTSSEDISLQIGETFSQGKACPQDPIAQSFFIYESAGCFITAVDVFFYKKPLGTFQPPIKLEIRPLDEGGNPSNIILPFGTVLKESVQVVTNKIDLTQGTLTVTGNDGSDGVNPPNSDDAGPWPSSNITNTSGRALTSGAPVSLSSNPPDDMIPTRFTFESPIFLQPNRSYCFVLISDSNEYNVWCAQSGPDVTGRDGVDVFREEGEVNTIIGTSTPILKDPYVQGIFFKSQNGISWTPDQSIDLKFKVWKSEFDVDINGEIEFVNEELPLRQLTLDPLQTKDGSSLIRVLHPTHGLTDNLPNRSKVVFIPKYDIILTGTLTSSGTTVTGVGTLFLTELVVGSIIQHPITLEQKVVTAIANNLSLTIDSAFVNLDLLGTSNVSATSYAFPSGSSLGGLDAELLLDYEGFDVILTEMDHYIIDVGTNATISGRFGGPNVCVMDNKRFDELLLITTPLLLPQTNITWNIQTTSSVGPNDSTHSSYEVLPRKNLVPNQKIVFDRPMHVSSYINERSAGDTPPGPSQVGTNGLGDKKSLNVRAVLSSNDRNVSPVIDTSRLSAFIIGNRLDDPHGVLDVGVDPSSIINSVFDEYQCVPTTDSPTVVSTAGEIHFNTSIGLLSGTSSASANSITVSGVGTAYLTELKIGDIVRIPSSAEQRKVVRINSDIEFRVDIAFGVSFSAEQIYTNPPPLRIKTADDDIAKHLSKLDIGKYVSISGALNPDRDFTDKLILNVEYLPNNLTPDPDLPFSAPAKAIITIDHKIIVASGMEANSITITQQDRFIDEIAPHGGSCSAKYVSKQLLLNRTSNALKIMFDAHRDVSCEIDLYYRTQANTTISLDNINWTKATYNLDVNGTLQNITPDPNSGPREMSSYEATLVGLPNFISSQVKIVMRGGNPSRSPLIKNFRMIALDE